MAAVSDYLLEKKKLTLFNGVALDQHCHACEGTGNCIHRGEYLGQCDTCDGRGTEITPEGEALLEFINTYVPKPNLSYGPN